MNEYRKLRDKQQDEVNKFPLGFAFGDTQFEKMMKKWGLNAKNDEDIKQIAQVYSGVFIQKKDIPAFNEMTQRHEEEMKAAIANDKTGDGFIYQMFCYELRNHEYGYTGNLEETIEALGYTFEDIECDTKLHHGLVRAAHDVMDESDNF